MACCEDGKKPIMILCASAASTSGMNVRSKKRPRIEVESESESEYSEKETDEESGNDEDSHDEEEYTEPQRKAIQVLKKTWESFNVEHNEDDIKGKWYGVKFQSSGKKKPVLYVAKVLNRFLSDKGGPVKSLLMQCLLPKVGSGNELKATPSHLPAVTSWSEMS